MVERYKSNTVRKQDSSPSQELPRRKPGFKKGNKFAKGRPKGTPNRIPGLIKDWIAGASEELGFLQPIWRTRPDPRNSKKKKYPDIKIDIVGWEPGEGGGQAFLVWLGCNHPTAFAQLMGRVMPYQINSTRTVEHTVASKFSDADIGRMSLTEKLAAFKDMIGMTRVMPPPENNRPRMIEGEVIGNEES